MLFREVSRFSDREASREASYQIGSADEFSEYLSHGMYSTNIIIKQMRKHMKEPKLMIKIISRFFIAFSLMKFPH